MLAGISTPPQERSHPYVLPAQVPLGQAAAGVGAAGQGGIGLLGAAGGAGGVQSRCWALLRALERCYTRDVVRRHRGRQEHTRRPAARRRAEGTRRAASARVHHLHARPRNEEA